MTAKEFWDNNWKWILGTLGILFTWAISAVIGFYAALRAIDTDITLIRERIVKSETEISSTIKPQISRIENLSQRIITLEGDFKFVKQETDIATRTNKSLEYLIEIERKNTVNELKELMQKK